jgi:hypothetical protein
MADKSALKLRRLINAAAQAGALAGAAKKRARLAKAQLKLARKAAKATKKAAKHARKLVEEARASLDAARLRARAKSMAVKVAKLAAPRKRAARISRAGSAAAVAKSIIKRLDDASPAPQPGGTPAGP